MVQSQFNFASENLYLNWKEALIKRCLLRKHSQLLFAQSAIFPPRGKLRITCGVHSFIFSFSRNFHLNEKMGSFIQIQENQLQEKFSEDKIEKRIRRTTKKHFVWDYGNGFEFSKNHNFFAKFQFLPIWNPKSLDFRNAFNRENSSSTLASYEVNPQILTHLTYPH